MRVQDGTCSFVSPLYYNLAQEAYSSSAAQETRAMGKNFMHVTQPMFLLFTKNCNENYFLLC